MRVVVVGGGFGGLASAARLAKLGHEVTLLERSDSLGGALGSVTADGYTWDAGPSYTLLPAVLRDLFRKSGRPLERELDLVPLDVVREHRFEDGSVLALPAGSRAAQIGRRRRARRGAGRPVDGVRRRLLRHVGAAAPRLPRAPVEPRAALRASSPACCAAARRWRVAPARRSATRGCALVAVHPFVAEGHEPAQRALVDGRHGVPRAAARRLDGARWAGGGGRRPRPADDHEAASTCDTASRPPTSSSAAAGRSRSRPARGELDADAVVCAVDPRRLPALAEHVQRTMPAIPPVVCHLGLEPGPPRCPTRWCSTATRCWWCAPAAARPRAARPGPSTVAGSWPRTSWSRWPGAGIDVRAQIVTRVDRHPATWSSAGAARRWACAGQGRRDRLGPARPDHPGPGGVRRRRARHARRRPPVRRPVGRAGRPGHRPGLTQPVRGTRKVDRPGDGRLARLARRARRRRPWPCADRATGASSIADCAALADGHDLRRACVPASPRGARRGQARRRTPPHARRARRERGRRPRATPPRRGAASPISAASAVSSAPAAARSSTTDRAARAGPRSRTARPRGRRPARPRAPVRRPARVGEPPRDLAVAATARRHARERLLRRRRPRGRRRGGRQRCRVRPRRALAGDGDGAGHAGAVDGS